MEKVLSFYTHIVISFGKNCYLLVPFLVNMFIDVLPVRLYSLLSLLFAKIYIEISGLWK